MKRLFWAFLVSLLLTAPAHAAVTFGIGTGLGSAEGKDSGHTYSSFTPLNLFIGYTGDSKYSAEFGYSQLADIEEKTKERAINISLNGIFLAGRYFVQISDSGFGYLKMGVHYWSGEVRVSDSHIP